MRMGGKARANLVDVGLDGAALLFVFVAPEETVRFLQTLADLDFLLVGQRDEGYGQAGEFPLAVGDEIDDGAGTSGGVDLSDFTVSIWEG